MSKTKKNCPECGHRKGWHAKRGSMFTYLCAIPYCPCTRTYESLVGEKGDKMKCPCLYWATTDFEYIKNATKQHHPNCDGHGNHVLLPLESEHFVTGLSVDFTAVDEPELQLLVIDIIGTCLVIAERGGIPKSVFRLPGSFLSDFRYYVDDPFDVVKTAIDGEKPVPRIERGNGGGYRLFDCNDKFGHELCEDAFRVYQETVGKPLPIYSGGKWEDLQPKTGLGWEMPVGIWRFTR